MKIQTLKKILILGSLLLGVFAHAQSVSGTVSDLNGTLLPGVSVIVKNTSNGVTTDFDGNYVLQNAKLGESIVFSYVGYATREIVVKNFNRLNVTLSEDTQSLDEVVVVGYGVQKKALVTGASVNVSGDDIAALNTGTAMQALQGTAAGVSITRDSGQPGAGTRVTIRGLGTVGNSDPLYIVDGVAVGNIDYLNASDIASIDILKDAASSAIYGSRAANGVVLVTTVTGRKDSPAKISFDSYYGLQNTYKNLDPLNAQEYMYIMNEGRVNDGMSPIDWQKELSNNVWLNDNFPGLGPEYGEEVYNNLQNGWEGTNWVDEMSQKNAPISSYSLNIVGGSEDITYSLGASYFDQEGVIGGNISDAGFNRFTTRINTQMVIKKNSEHAILTVGENFTYTNTENRSVATGNIYWNDLHNALVANPLQPAYWQQSIDYGVDKFGYSPTFDGYSEGLQNPLAVLFYRHNYNYGKGNQIVGNVFLELEPIKDLKIRSSYGVNAWFGHGRSMYPTYHLGVLYKDNTDGVEQSQYFGNDWTWSTTASYKRSFGDHNLTALVGTELLQNQINTNVKGVKSFENSLKFPGDPRYAYLNNTNNPVSVSDIGAEGADWGAQGGGLLSYLARVEYNYKEKYLFSAVVRADGSSNFAKDNRWGTFPSFSAGWVLTQEDFMSNSSNWLDFTKIRASWGQNGNQSIPNFIYSSNIAFAFPGYFFGDTKPVSGTTSYPANVVNPDVTWETSEQLDFGIDMRMFNSRLGVTFDWYNKKTKDWLVKAPILGTFGAAAPYINGGDIKNSGVELVLNWQDEINNFRYGVTLTGTQNKNEVTRIDNAEGIIHGPSNVLSQGTGEVSRVQVGQPIGFFIGYKTDGIIQNQNEADAWVIPATDIDGNTNANAGQPYFDDQRPGDVRFVDQDQNGVLDDADNVYLGNPNPDFEMGVQINLGYKAVYLNTTLAGKFGMQVMQSYRSFADSFTQNFTSDVFDRWHGEGTSNTMPRLSYVSNRNSQNISDIYMHDADFLRINNLTIGYDFAQSPTNVKGFSTLKLYVSMTNLYTFTKYDGMDPDVRFNGNGNSEWNWASGIDLGLYPQARTVMFGLSLDF